VRKKNSSQVVTMAHLPTCFFEPLQFGMAALPCCTVYAESRFFLDVHLTDHWLPCLTRLSASSSLCGWWARTGRACGHRNPPRISSRPILFTYLVRHFRRGGEGVPRHQALILRRWRGSSGNNRRRLWRQHRHRIDGTFPHKRLQSNPRSDSVELMALFRDFESLQRPRADQILELSVAATPLTAQGGAPVTIRPVSSERQGKAWRARQRRRHAPRR